MKIIISGGTGLIGVAAAERFISLGHRVWVLSRHPQSARVPAGVDVIGWDGAGGRGLQQFMAEADAVIHLAGVSLSAGRWTPRQKKKIVSSREDSGRALVQAIAGSPHKPRVLLQISGVGYYGFRGDEVITESGSGGTDFAASVCVRWEDATRPVESLGVRHVVMRTGLVLSTQGGVLPRIMLPFKMFVGGPMGSGRQWWAWIHLQDQISAMLFLLETDTAEGIYNLTSPNPLPMAQFGRILARVLRRPYWFPAPAFALQLALGEMSTLVLTGQRVVPQRLLAQGFQFQYPQLNEALQDLIIQKS